MYRRDTKSAVQVILVNFFKVTQGSVLNTGHFFCKLDSIIFDTKLKIRFTAVNHLANRTVPQIFVAFKEMYQYYLHRGFCITAVHSDGEFAPFQALVAS